MASADSIADLLLFVDRIVQAFLKEGYFPTEIRPIGWDLNKAQSAIHRNGSGHARAMTVKANPFVSLLDRHRR
jgi:hypothetical protein